MCNTPDSLDTKPCDFQNKSRELGNFLPYIMTPKDSDIQSRESRVLPTPIFFIFYFVFISNIAIYIGVLDSLDTLDTLSFLIDVRRVENTLDTLDTLDLRKKEVTT